MIDKGYKSTSEVADFGHNLRRLFQEARVGANELASTGIEGSWVIPNISNKTTGETISVSEWHTAWRYGVDVSDEDDAAYSFLSRMIAALEKQMNK